MLNLILKVFLSLITSQSVLNQVLAFLLNLTFYPFSLGTTVSSVSVFTLSVHLLGRDWPSHLLSEWLLEDSPKCIAQQRTTLHVWLFFQTPLNFDQFQLVTGKFPPHFKVSGFFFEEAENTQCFVVISERPGTQVSSHCSLGACTSDDKM